MLKISTPKSDERMRPVKKTPLRNRGQRFLSGSKKTGVARYVLIQDLLNNARPFCEPSAFLSFPKRRQILRGRADDNLL